MNSPELQTHAGFKFTIIGWHEIDWNKRAQNYSLGQFLEQRIDLSAFGSKIESIRFIPIMGPPPAIAPFPSEMIFHRSRKELGLYWRMDYEKVMNLSLPDFKTYLADFFIDVLEIAKTTKRIRDFDYDGFIAAVKAVLPEWLAADSED
jgi:hypothetical protein